MTLVACADDDSQRRFANDPIPTEDLTAAPTTPPQDNLTTATVPVVSPVSTDQLLSSAGTATRLYVQSGPAVLAVPADGSAPTVVFDAGPESIRALSATTDGARFAVVIMATNGDLSLVVCDETGKTIARADLGKADSATPIAGQAGEFALAWSPAGDRILVGHAGGGILEVTVSGSVRALLPAVAAPSPRSVAWSPSGAAIAFVDAGPSGNATGLYVASTDVLPVDPVAVVRPIEGQSRQIVAIEWPAGEAGILYSERAPNGDLSVGGDLFAVSPAGGNPQLVASARSVAQVAAVDTFRASPDGLAVAYTVVVTGDGGAVSGDLLVKQIAGPTVVDLAISEVEVETLGWTAAGLTWVTSHRGGDSGSQLSVQHARPDGTVQTLYEPSNLATPKASPVGSPLASPVADADSEASEG